MSRSPSTELLLEIGTEELPAAAQEPMARSLAEGLGKLLDAHSLSPASIRPLWGPRRLAVVAAGVPEIEPDRQEERRGPGLKVAFDKDGNPTKAAEGFARSVGVAVEDLQKLVNDKGEAWLVHREMRKGQTTADILMEELPELLHALPQPRRMRWNDSGNGFLRPVRWLCVRLGKATVPIEAFGLTATGDSAGHRVHHPKPVPIASVGKYAEALAAAHVLADPGERRARIMAEVDSLAESLDALPAPPNEGLYDELAGLAEWPVALKARFDPGFLELPEAVVVTTLAHHQRFIPLRDRNGGLLPDFIAIANLESRDPEQVRRGFARVVRPRLEDARFYYQRDRARPITAYVGELKDLQFGPKLGTMADKSLRLAALCEHITRLEDWPDGDPAAARRAGELAKCDLVTGMVFEFPELQGVMGGLYAAASEPEEVALAISEQYQPAGATDQLPGTATGAALALADRLDTLVGGFAAGLAPSGTKDPFGLRRAAFGALRIVNEWAPQLDLEPAVRYAAQLYAADLEAPRAVPDVLSFLRDRLRSLILEQGERPDIAQAVLAVAPLAPGIVLARAQALRIFGEGPHAGALAAANKRIANLLRQASDAELDSRTGEGIAVDEAELALSEALKQGLPVLDAALEERDYARGLEALAELREPVDRFFDEVLVMDPDPQIRARRLNLLGRLRNAFLRIADIGELQPPGNGTA